MKQAHVFYERFKEKLINKFGDVFDFSLADGNYKNLNTPITLICKIHNEPFTQTPHEILLHGCPLCYQGNYIKEKTEFYKKVLTERYKDVIPHVDFSKITFPGSWQEVYNHPVTIICEECGPVETTLGKLLTSTLTYPCPNHFNRGESLRLTKEEFIRRANECHEPEEYGYSDVVYKSFNDKVWIKHNKCGRKFQQTVHAHLKGQGCSYCNNRKLFYPLEVYLEKVKEIHGDKYDYSRVPLTYKNLHSKIEIICKIEGHGSWWANADGHLNDHTECPVCTMQKRIMSWEEFLEKSIKVHGDKYDYSFAEILYKEALSKGVNLINLPIFCKNCNSFFEQSKYRHILGSGCSYCNASSMENKIKDFLENNGIKYFFQKRYKWLYFVTPKNPLKLDFYLPEYNICIEYQGEQHYRPVEYFGGAETLGLYQQRDFKKKKILEKNNINVIKYSFKDSIEYIENNLSKILGVKKPKYTKLEGNNSKPISPFYKRFNKRIRHPMKRNTVIITRTKQTNITRITKRNFKNILKKGKN